MFCSIKETPNEIPVDTEQIARNVMIEKLNLAKETVEQMKLERVHRSTISGQNQNFPRKIICKFDQFTERELVR